MQRKHQIRADRRLDRQLELMTRRFPRAATLVQRLRQPGYTIIRVPIAIALITGGFLAMLPVFGLWMIPLGLVLLAIDIPVLRAPVAAAIIRMRRRIDTWRQRNRN